MGKANTTKMDSLLRRSADIYKDLSQNQCITMTILSLQAQVHLGCEEETGSRSTVDRWSSAVEEKEEKQTSSIKY